MRLILEYVKLYTRWGLTKTLSPLQVQILMCISQVPTKGGESEFADGFHVAEQMRQRYPEEFKLLTEMPVRFFDIGADYYEYHKLHTAPTIEWVELALWRSWICILCWKKHYSSTKSMQILVFTRRHYKAIPHYCLFVRGIHQSPVDSSHQRPIMLSLEWATQRIAFL